MRGVFFRTGRRGFPLLLPPYNLMGFSRKRIREKWKRDKDNTKGRKRRGAVRKEVEGIEIMK